MIKNKIIIPICFFFALTATAYSSSYDFYVDKNSSGAAEDGSGDFAYE